MTGLQQAVQLLQTGRFAEAESLLRLFLKSAPAHPGALFLQGNCFAQRGAWVDAIGNFEKAIALAPNFLDARLGLARLHQQMGNTQEAELCLCAAVVAAPGSAGPPTALGLLLFKADRFPEAEQSFRQAARLEPTQPMAHKNLGDAIWSQGREGEATGHHFRAIDNWKDAPDAVFFLHVWLTLTAQGQQAQALLIAEKWLRLDPSDAVALHCKAASGGQNPERASDGYIAEMFDQFSLSFDEQLAALSYQGPALVAEALRKVSPQCVAAGLDGGCGTGLCAPLLRPLARRLVGVDLSSKMLQRARERGGYDELVEQELTRYLQTLLNSFDWIVSSDTLNYFGRLDAVAQAALQAMRPGGYLIFTLEHATTQAPFTLLPHGRYCHSSDYVADALAAAGFEQPVIDVRSIRSENRQAVMALVVTAHKPAA